MSCSPRPAGLRFVARSLLEPWAEAAGAAPSPVTDDPAHQPVGALIHDDPVICAPETTIREAAERMAAAPATSVVVELDDGTLGILTDRDLRTRVVAGGLSGDTPVSAAMSAPAYTCGPERLGGEVLLEMLDRGFRHFPVVSATGRILGVVDDMDIVAAQTRSSFYLRQAIARAQALDELEIAARQLHPMVIAMHDAGLAAASITAVYAVVVDALTRRLLELAVAEAGEPGADFAWLALGSQARREAMPSSDVDSAIVWFGELAPDKIRPYLHAVATKVVGGLEACGLYADAHGATAGDPPFIRSLESWQRAVRSWIADPTQEKALILVSVLVDSRPGVGNPHGHAGSGHVPPSAEQSGAAASAGPVRALAPTADGVPARTGRRALGRASRPARSQARRRDPDRGPGALGRHRGGRHERLDDRAPAGGCRRRNAVGGRRAHARGRLRADQRRSGCRTRWSSSAPAAPRTTSSTRPRSAP